MKRLLLILLLCSPLFGATYYVDPQNTLGTSADTNNGTAKATAWIHAPGMTGCASTCSSTTLNAGDSVIVRGGTTIPASYLSWTLPARNGSAGNVIYYGVDLTWFVGGSFTRPVINGGNPLSTSFVASCTGGANSGTQVQIASTRAFLTFDNFEFTGFCWTGNISSNGAMINIDGGATNIIVSNVYCHGWTMTSGASDNFPCITSFGGGTVADNNQFTFDVFDGVDSPHFVAGTPISGNSPACQWSSDGNSGITNVVESAGSVVTVTTVSNLSAFGGGGQVQLGGLGVATWLNGLAPITASSVTASTVVFTDPTSHGTLASQAETGVVGFSSCASGQGINGSHAYTVDHSVFRYLSNDVVTANCHSYHDNLFEYLYATFASGSLQQHPNVMNCLGGDVANLYWYNNTMRHTFVTEDVYFAVRTNLYYFNNLTYDNMNTVFGPPPFKASCLRFNTVANSSLPVNAFIYNNTDGDNSCQVRFEVSNAPLTQWSGTGTFENNHYGAQGSNCAGTCGTSLPNIYTCATAGTCTVTNNGTHVFQTTATENAQGYTAGNLYQPTTGGTTIGAGTNASGSCATFSGDSALCTGSSAGVSEVAGNGGKIASSPAVTLVARGSTWDAGAYQFQSTASASTCSPGSGTYTATQTPACTNPNGGTTVQCYTTNGSTPATNGLGTACTAGTLLASGGTVSIAVNTTLKIIAGTSLLPDSSVTTYTYVLQGGAPTCSPTGGTYSGTQTVTLTSPQSQSMCYTVNGTTPSSNGSGTCSVGSLYSGTISVASTETINSIAMTSGWTDSSVGSCAYVINGGGGGSVGTAVSNGVHILNGVVIK